MHLVRNYQVINLAMGVWFNLMAETEERELYSSENYLARKILSTEASP